MLRSVVEMQHRCLSILVKKGQRREQMQLPIRFSSRDEDNERRQRTKTKSLDKGHILNCKMVAAKMALHVHGETNSTLAHSFENHQLGEGHEHALRSSHPGISSEECP